MPSLEDLMALRERERLALAALLEGAQSLAAPDHDFDVEIARWLYETGEANRLVSYDPELYVIRHDGWCDSIDATFGLVSSVLPGWRRVVEEKGDHWWLGLHAPDDDPVNPTGYFRARGATAPLAGLAALFHTLLERNASRALLTAKIAEAETSHATR